MDKMFARYTTFPQAALDRLMNGKSLIKLEAEGGRGKTFCLRELYRLLLKTEKDGGGRQFVPIYVPASRIERSIWKYCAYKYFGRGNTDDTEKIDDLIALYREDVFNADESDYHFVVIVDGTNEFFAEYDLKGEIREFAELKNCSVVISTRTRNNYFDDLKFNVFRLGDLPKSVIDYYAGEQPDRKMYQLLAYPFYLAQYVELKEKNGEVNYDNAYQLIEAYIDFSFNKIAENIGGKTVDNRTLANIVKKAGLILPVVCIEMEKAGGMTFSLNNKALTGAITSAYPRIGEGDVSVVCETIAQTGIIRAISEDGVRFIIEHQIYRDYYAAVYLRRLLQDRENCTDALIDALKHPLVEDVFEFLVNALGGAENARECAEYLNDCVQGAEDLCGDAALNGNIVRFFACCSSDLCGVPFRGRNLTAADFSPFYTVRDCDFRGSRIGSDTFPLDRGIRLSGKATTFRVGKHIVVFERMIGEIYVIDGDKGSFVNSFRVAELLNVSEMWIFMPTICSYDDRRIFVSLENIISCVVDIITGEKEFIDDGELKELYNIGVRISLSPDKITRNYSFRIDTNGQRAVVDYILDYTFNTNSEKMFSYINKDGVCVYNGVEKTFFEIKNQRWFDDLLDERRAADWDTEDDRSSCYVGCFFCGEGLVFVFSSGVYFTKDGVFLDVNMIFREEQIYLFHDNQNVVSIYDAYYWEKEKRLVLILNEQIDIIALFDPSTRTSIKLTDYRMALVSQYPRHGLMRQRRIIFNEDAMILNCESGVYSYRINTGEIRTLFSDDDYTTLEGNLIEFDDGVVVVSDNRIEKYSYSWNRIWSAEARNHMTIDGFDIMNKALFFKVSGNNICKRFIFNYDKNAISFFTSKRGKILTDRSNTVSYREKQGFNVYRLDFHGELYFIKKIKNIGDDKVFLISELMFDLGDSMLVFGESVLKNTIFYRFISADMNKSWVSWVELGNFIYSHAYKAGENSVVLVGTYNKGDKRATRGILFESNSVRTLFDHEDVEGAVWFKNHRKFLLFRRNEIITVDISGASSTRYYKNCVCYGEGISESSSEKYLMWSFEHYVFWLADDGVVHTFIMEKADDSHLNLQEDDIWSSFIIRKTDESFLGKHPYSVGFYARFRHKEGGKLDGQLKIRERSVTFKTREDGRDIFHIVPIESIVNGNTQGEQVIPLEKNELLDYFLQDRYLVTCVAKGVGDYAQLIIRDVETGEKRIIRPFMIDLHGSNFTGLGPISKTEKETLAQYGAIFEE